eukprot:TRINITY_DN23122_c0_g1_i1.p1 TRINITY_DN23122_c0_g1~~TRINITY_DN23122_c0_g1_i1.p1  ORF type:complete len:936 (+),score=174.35 TRINITY_DN23122_c0_g1_i1:98-2905(+)
MMWRLIAASVLLRETVLALAPAPRREILPRHLQCSSMLQHQTPREAARVWKQLGGKAQFRGDVTCCSLDKVGSIIDYAKLVLDFKANTMEQQREFANEVARSISLSTSQSACQPILASIIRSRAEALTEKALPFGHKGIALQHAVVRSTLRLHCLLPRSAKSRHEASNQEWRMTRKLADILEALSSAAGAVLDQDQAARRDVDEALERCFQLPFVATLAGASFAPADRDMHMHDLTYPFRRAVGSVRTWHVWVDRFSLTLSRFLAKLGYQLKIWTAGLDQNFLQGAGSQLFWGSKDWLLNSASQMWRWPNHPEPAPGLQCPDCFPHCLARQFPNSSFLQPLTAAGSVQDAALSDTCNAEQMAANSQVTASKSRFAIVLLISNRTGIQTLETAWQGAVDLLEASEGLEILFLEDSVRQPWETAVRPVFSGGLLRRCRWWLRSRSGGAAHSQRLGVVWRRHQVTLTNLEAAAAHIRLRTEHPESMLVLLDVRGAGGQGNPTEADAAEINRVTALLKTVQYQMRPGERKRVAASVPGLHQVHLQPLVKLQDQLRHPGLEATLQELGPYLEFHRRAIKMLQEDPAGKGRLVRSLVYVCNPFTLCGGHGDRTNGILSAFVLALLTSRAFFIDFDSPLPLNLLLQPRRFEDLGSFVLDWRIQGFGALGAGGHSFYLDDRVAFQEDVAWLVQDPAKVLQVSMNHREIGALLAHPLLADRAEELGLRRWPYLYARLWDVLFEPTPLLQARLETAAEHLKLYDDQDSSSSLSTSDARRPQAVLPWISAPENGRESAGFLAIHFRAGNESARLWWDPGRHHISSLPDFLACAALAESELGLLPTTRWFLSVDTMSALEVPEVRELRRTGKVVVLDEGWNLAHVDRSHVNLGLQGFTDSYVAYLLLASARAIVLSRSYFGETAAEIGAVPHAYFAEGCVRTDLHGS